MRIGGEERWIAAEDAGLYRDALGAVPPGGLPAAFLEEVEEPLARLVRRYARTHGPFTTREPPAATRVDLGPVLRELERAGGLVRGELRPGGASASGATPTCSAACGAPRSPRCARRSSRPSSERSRASCPPGRASTQRPPAGRGRRPPARAARAAPRGGAGAPGLGARRAAAPGRRLLAGLDGPALRERRAGLGGRGRARAQLGAGRALLPRGRSLARAAPVQGRAPGRASCTTRSASASSGAPRSGPTCSPTSARPSRSSCRRRSGTSSGPVRSPTTPSPRCGRRG